ncbi:hypothetical protein [Terriglobus sp. ADX1]|uniref:hypothetical protein n=1 Tax=Terriglobus sp. ADX1 TaxID=2794063 RepID=UPI002FE5F20A
MFIALQTLVLMVIFTILMTRVSDEESSAPKGRYYLGFAVALVAWLVADFVV